MAFNPSIPNPNDFLSSSQGQLKTNFTSLDNVFGIDHTPFSVGANAGYHKQVHLLNEAAPGLGTANGVLFANTFAGQSWPIWQNALGTFNIISGNTAANASTNGYFYTQAGILVQWGRITGGGINGNTQATGTVTFSSANIAFPNNCYMVLALPFWNSNSTSQPNSAGTINIDIFTLSKTKFDWTFNSNSTKYAGFFWLAIGN